MSIKKTIRHSAETVINWTLMIGVIASIGLLSFCGMWVILPSIPLAIAAFILAGFVEGEVFKRNIFAGMKDLRLLSRHGLETLIIQSLHAQLNPKIFNPTSASPFLKMYNKQWYLVASFEEKSLAKKQKEAQKQAKRRLKYMQQYFIKNVLNAPRKNDELLGDDALKIINAIKSELPALRRKISLLRIGALVSLVAGIAFSLATASSLAMAGTALAISLSGFIWPLSIIAGVGYVFLIFHTTKDILFNETVTKWRERLAKWFTPREYKDEKTGKITKETSLHYWLRTICTGTLIALSVLVAAGATLATAGTWWYAVRAGAQLLSALARAAYVLTAVLVPISAIATFIFSLRNSFQSVKQIVKQTKNINPWQWIKHKIAQIFAADKNENAWQAVNPFRILARIISLPYTLCVFIGHAISMGLTGDRIPDHEIPCLILGTSNDSLNDFHYLFDEGHDHHHHKKIHQTDDDHHHGTIPSHFLKVILSPLLLCAAIWKYAFSHLNQTPLSFTAALKGSFDWHHDSRLKSEPMENKHVNKAWKLAEVSLRFEQERTRLRQVQVKREIAAEKITVLNKAEKQLKTGIEQDNLKPLDVNRKCLNHSRLFATPQTQTKRFMDKIERDFVPTAAASA